jgi:restriction system protein
MGSFDGGRRAELEAHQALWNLWHISRQAAWNVDNWEVACALLQTHYTVANARQDPEVCAMRIRYLEICEPPPRLADFVQAPPYDRISDSPRQLGLARYAYLMARQRHPERERQRLTELETTKALYRSLKDAEARAEATELARKREWQKSRWPKNVALEVDVYHLDGVAAQVEFQNAKIESHVNALSELLHVGLQNLPDVPLSEPTGPAGVASRVESLLAAMTLPCGIESRAKVAYSAGSGQLTVEYELPTVDIIPTAESYRYIESHETVVEITRPSSRVKALYSNTIAQLALLSLAAILAADSERHIDAVVFDGVVDTSDPGSGQSIRPCLISARVTHDAFAAIGVGQADPATCLERLSATMSQNPTELVPVQPFNQ